MKLVYTHWKAGRVERDVTPLQGRPNYFMDRARVYFVGPMTAEVRNAGRVINGIPQILSSVEIGWDGYLTEHAHICEECGFGIPDDDIVEDTMEFWSEDISDDDIFAGVPYDAKRTHYYHRRCKEYADYEFQRGWDEAKGEDF